MIIDSLDLTPRRGRLLSPTDQLNLAPEKRGDFGPAPDGVAYGISGLAIYFEMDGLENLLATQSENLIRIETRKEVVPGLVLDPYDHRMHSIGGREDFGAGTITGGRVASVDGRDTLCVADGKTLDWRSAVFGLREAARIGSTHWDLAPSRHATGFRYLLAAEVWTSGTDPLAGPGQPIELAPEWTLPDAHRCNNSAVWPADVTAYRLLFKAESNDQGRFSLRGQPGESEGLARALLRSVTLAEVIDHGFTFRSLLEIGAASVQAGFQPPHGPARGYAAGLAYAATLEDGDGLSVVLDPGFNPVHFEARVIGTEYQRPGTRSEG